MRPQRTWDLAKNVQKLNDNDKATIFSPSERSLVITSTIFEDTIRGRFWIINAHAEQKRSELSGNGNDGAIQKPHNGYYSQWRGADKWGRDRKRSRPWALRDGADRRGHARSPIVSQALLRTRIFMGVGQWSKTTIYPKWQNNPVQHGKLRADCCPRIVDRFFQLERKNVFYIVIAGHVWWHFVKSSNKTKWRHKRSNIG